MLKIWAIFVYTQAAISNVLTDARYMYVSYIVLTYMGVQEHDTWTDMVMTHWTNILVLLPLYRQVFRQKDDKKQFILTEIVFSMHFNSE